MPDAYQFFGSHQAIHTAELLARAIELAPRVSPQVGYQVARITADFARELDQIAARTATFADERIRAEIRATQRRPDSDKSVHLIDLIRSEPYLLGSVRVALISELDKAIDPEYPQSGPYWRAQEYGMAMDRWLVGMFFGAGEEGGMDVPRAQFKGGGGPGFTFIPGQPGGGLGHFDTPLQARHFLQRGADEAAVFYSRELTTLSHSTAGRIDAVLSELKRTGRTLP